MTEGPRFLMSRRASLKDIAISGFLMLPGENIIRALKDIFSVFNDQDTAIKNRERVKDWREYIKGLPYNSDFIYYQDHYMTAEGVPLTLEDTAKIMQLSLPRIPIKPQEAEAEFGGSSLGWSLKSDFFRAPFVWEYSSYDNFGATDQRRTCTSITPGNTLGLIHVVASSGDKYYDFFTCRGGPEVSPATTQIPDLLIRQAFYIPTISQSAYINVKPEILDMYLMFAAKSRAMGSLVDAGYYPNSCRQWQMIQKV